MPLALCPDCGKPRNPDTCYPNKKSADGLQRLCRVCDNARRRRNYKLPPLCGAKPTCTECAGQCWRVKGRVCVCGRRYAPQAPVRADTERRGVSAWAMAMTDG